MNYLKIYDDLILNAKSENRKRNKENYFEEHHIIPVCVGGLNIKINKVLLTAKEHFVCHKLLTKIYPTVSKLIYALWMMSTTKKSYKRDYRVGAREYERTKKEWSKNFSGENNPNFGRKCSQEVKDKLSKANTGKILSEKTKEKLRQINLGKPSKIKGLARSDESKLKNKIGNTGKSHSEITKNKMSLKRIGVPKSIETKDKMRIGAIGKKMSKEAILKMKNNANNRPIITCPYCGKTGDNSNIKRWHFDNCKFKN